MQVMTALFTTRPFNPMSIAIRAISPISLFKMAPASHVIIIDGDSGYAIEASMMHGVRRVNVDVALSGSKVVKRMDFEVEDAEAGLLALREIAWRGAKYDFKGALGLALEPDRNWQEDSEWFCSELFAYGLQKAGRPLFGDNARVTPYMLMCIAPYLKPQA